MKTTIKTLHVEAGKTLLKFLDKKLEKIIQHCPSIQSADVLLKQDLAAKTHDKVCRIFIMGQAKNMQVIKRGDTFEEAITAAVGSVVESCEKNRLLNSE